MISLAAARFTGCLIVLTILRATPAPEFEPVDELKAAIVLNFLRFAEWPRSESTNSITVGVYGRSSFAQVLRRTLEGKAVNNRALHVVELKYPTELQSCDAIYFATTKETDVRQILNSPQGANALSIGESKDFLQLGGAVNLLVIDGRMSFEVDLAALDRTGVAISSKLLRFGQIHGRRKGEL